MESNDRVAAVKDKVQRYLLEVLNTISLDREGNFTIRQGSTQVFVRVDAFGESNTAVRIVAPIIREAPATPELFKYVATGNNYRFGHLAASEEDGKVSILFSHSLLGDFLDPDELKLAVVLLARTADELDDQIKSQFGGKSFHEG